MTVLGTEQPYEQYTGTGDRLFFEYGFTWNGQEVFVLVDGVPVTFTQQSTGVLLDEAPAIGVPIIIYRLTDITQLADFQPFEAFPAAKTEDALDKLILLKQEAAIWRADLNLYADQQVAWTDLVNNKGSTPRIFLWDEDQSGVFSGEVTEKMPNPGAFVLSKPENFAYFQCGGSPILTEVVTSTLYPIEATEEMAPSANLDSAYLEDITFDELGYVGGAIGGSITAIKLEYGPDEDTLSYVGGPTGVTIIELKVEYGPDTDSLSYVGGVVGGRIKPGLVTALAPPEEIQMTANLDTTNCFLVDE